MKKIVKHTKDKQEQNDILAEIIAEIVAAAGGFEMERSLVCVTND